MFRVDTTPRQMGARMPYPSPERLKRRVDVMRFGEGMVQREQKKPPVKHERLFLIAADLSPDGL